MTVDFPADWCGTDLREARPCTGTYQYYPCATLPPLDGSRFTGAFDWYGGEVGEPASPYAALVEAIAAELAGAGLALPEDFRHFFTRQGLCGALDAVSATDCEADLSLPFVLPADEGARLVRFLRDSQSVGAWYLYLRPGGEVFVVHSWLVYEHRAELMVRYADELEDGEDIEDFRTDGVPLASDFTTERDPYRRCADSFEEFAYRYILENRTLLALLRGTEPDAEGAAYLAHYTG